MKMPVKIKKKYCNFCGEPMAPEDKECKQCGWDVSHDGAPTSDPADNKARVGVAAGLIVAYAVTWFLIQGTPMPVKAEAHEPRVVADVEEPLPASDAATMTLSPAMAAPPATTTKESLISIKVADVKATTVPAHDALQYAFALPQTDQKCRLVGSTKGVSGFGGNIEVFLLTDDEYVFWNANPAAIAQSSWETHRGSENTLDYDLPTAGNYHFVVSNEMGLSPQTMAVKAQVKCVW
ncbi:MAG TPA: hypothetical protein VFP26_01445 [Gemmatimonadaceae bacterium]|jgi:SH3-like domain-containing protein|nr:hypothetical protein [Gemmatimonadaceae bacterium]